MLLHCINSILSQWGFILRQCLLTSMKKECLLDWILSINSYDMSSWITTVCDMMCILVTQQQQLTIQSTVSKNWVQRFINCYDLIKSKYNQKYDYQWAKCEDSELIWAWFQHIQAMIMRISITLMKLAFKWALYLLQRWLQKVIKSVD